jgi:transcriptional regulator with XRE-family HTH domain
MWKLSGQLLRNTREALRLTRLEFGALMGVSGEFIGKIELGIRPIPATMARRLVATGHTSMKKIALIHAKDAEHIYMEKCRAS